VINWLVNSESPERFLKVGVEIEPLVRNEIEDCLSFLDAFLEYHQINKEDQEKTSFIIDVETHCCRVMSFGLKNT
jgi:hypothetical protein